MPGRSTVSQVSQIGVESPAAPGTAVAATRRLGSLNITPSIQAETEMFRPDGMKFPTTQVLNREWAEVELEGTPTFEELIYPLSGVCGPAVKSTVMDGATPTGATEWVYTPETLIPDEPVTFTLQRGQAGTQAERFAHLMFAGFGIEVSRTGVSLSGAGFARRAEKAITMTAGLPAPTALTPVTPGMFSVYLSAVSQADLSTAGASKAANRLGRVISTNPSIEDHYTPAWFVNQADESFTTWVENADGVGGTTPLTVEANDVGMNLLDRLRDGATAWLRLEALGPVIYSAGTQTNLRHMLRWDQAVKVEGVESWSDEDGIYAIPWTFAPVHDSTWGKAQQITVRNKVAAL